MISKNAVREYKECYIAFLDLLGFKELIKHNDCDFIVKLFDIVEEEFFVTVSATNERVADFDLVYRKIMSDSICFYTNTSDDDALVSLIAICNYFQINLLRYNKPILSRGAIVKGYLYHDKDIMFGPGFVEAYQMEEKAAKYPRIIVTRDVIDSIGKNVKHKNYIKEFVIEEEDNICSIDYLYLFYGLSHEQESWKNFALHVKHEVDTEIDTSKREKYLYLDEHIIMARDKFMERYGAS